MNKYKQLINTKKDDVVFIKQVLVQPRIKFKNLNDLNDKVNFIKQVPVYPRNRLKKLSKRRKAAQLILHPQNRLPNDKLLKHPRNKFTARETQVARNNVSRLINGEFDFSLKNILNKTLLFDTNKINEEVIMEKITESVSDPLNDTYYIDHSPGTYSFTLKGKGGR